jgi:von Willebrand factor type A domain/Aerotolerance regulator N-terminal
MTLAGLPLSTLLAIGGAAGALVVVFYILKLRRRPVAVPFSRVWDSVFRDKESSQLFSQLRRLLSLLLQLALLALLLAALGDPQPSRDLADGRHLVILVDASASMKAVDVKPSRIQAAKLEVKNIVRGLGGADRALIVQMASVPTPLSTMSGEVTELEPAVDRVTASDTRADLERGLLYARDSLRGLPKGEIVIVSDGALGDVAGLGKLDLGGAALRFVPVGKSGTNVAITEFSVRRYPLDKARYEVMLEVTNTNDKPAQVELSLLGDGAVVDVSRLQLGPNERLPRFYKDLAGASRNLEATIKLIGGGKDDLPADDHAYALLPERRRARILVVTRGNTYLEAALLLDEYLDVTLISPTEYPPKEKHDVAIFDAVAPPISDKVGSVLYLNPPSDGSPVPIDRTIEDFGFDTWDKKSAVLRFSAMGDIQAAKGHTFKPRQGDRIVGASEHGPILVSGSEGGHGFLALGFDPRDSDFVLRVAWPLFVINSINYFIEEDTNYVSSFRTGDVWRIPVSSVAESATLVDPKGARVVVPVKEGRAVYLGEQAGFYKLVAGSEAEGAPIEFAANLSDIEESRITPVKELTLEKVKAGKVAAFAPSMRKDIWIYLLAAVALVSLIEWITYHRRVTV